MNTSAVPDLQTAGCINRLFRRSHNNEYNMYDVCLLLVQARAVTLRIERSQRRWHGVLTPRNILSMVASELWTKTEGRYGMVYPQASYWNVRSVIGKVMAPMSSLSSGKAQDGNGSQIKCLGGWVGPCPYLSPPSSEFDFALYAELDARPPSFDAAGWESRQGVGGAAEWIEPVPPPRSTDTARLQALRLSKVNNISETIESNPATATGMVKPLQCRARLDFFLTRSKTTVWLRLYVNSIFVAAPKCPRGSGGAAHRFDPCKAAAYTFRTLSIEDLPQAELEGMEGPGLDGGSGDNAAVTVINATGGVEAEAFARAWCCQKGVDAVVWERDRGRCCFKCALTVAGPEGLGLKVLIMI
ncbi:hypothetical protein P885DRAFT_42255 [Corynascus similis CBS 632.67]